MPSTARFRRRPRERFLRQERYAVTVLVEGGWQLLAAHLDRTRAGQAEQLRDDFVRLLVPAATGMAIQALQSYVLERGPSAPGEDLMTVKVEAPYTRHPLAFITFGLNHADELLATLDQLVAASPASDEEFVPGVSLLFSAPDDGPQLDPATRAAVWRSPADYALVVLRVSLFYGTLAGIPEIVQVIAAQYHLGMSMLGVGHWLPRLLIQRMLDRSHEEVGLYSDDALAWLIERGMLHADPAGDRLLLPPAAASIVEEWEIPEDSRALARTAIEAAIVVYAHALVGSPQQGALAELVPHLRALVDADVERPHAEQVRLVELLVAALHSAGEHDVAASYLAQLAATDLPESA